MVEASLVFKWARDYYIEELPKKASEKDIKIVQKKAEVIAEKKEVTVIKNTNEYDKDGNGLLFDF